MGMWARHLSIKALCRGGIAPEEHPFTGAARNSLEMYHVQGVLFNPAPLELDERGRCDTGGKQSVHPERGERGRVPRPPRPFGRDQPPK
jgi:hypothetical protein